VIREGESEVLKRAFQGEGGGDCSPSDGSEKKFVKKEKTVGPDE